MGGTDGAEQVSFTSQTNGEREHTAPLGWMLALRPSPGSLLEGPLESRSPNQVLSAESRSGGVAVEKRPNKLVLDGSAESELQPHLHFYFTPPALSTLRLDKVPRRNAQETLE